MQIPFGAGNRTVEVRGFKQSAAAKTRHMHLHQLSDRAPGFDEAAGPAGSVQEELILVNSQDSKDGGHEVLRRHRRGLRHISLRCRFTDDLAMLQATAS